MQKRVGGAEWRDLRGVTTLTGRQGRGALDALKVCRGEVHYCTV